MPLRADWAALVPFDGIQNLPDSLALLGETAVESSKVTVPLAAITLTGAAGSMTFINGIFIASSYVAPT